MRKIQINIDWSLVFWVSIIILFLWLLAKAIGLIHTPIIIEAIPYIAGFMALLGMAKEFGKIVGKLDNTILDISEMKWDIKTMKQDIHSLDKRVSVVESKI